MATEKATPNGQQFHYAEDPTQLQRFCRHWFMFGIGFGSLLLFAGFGSAPTTTLVTGGLLLLSGIAAGYHATNRKTTG